MTRNATNSGPTPPQEYFLPAVDALETEDELVLIADMPGVRLEDLEVTVEEGILTLSGQVIAPAVESRETLQQEFLRGDYFRQFRMPRDFAADRINATFKNGVVTVRIPREEKTKPRKIPIKVE
jgi:HSP20 family protein